MQCVKQAPSRAQIFCATRKIRNGGLKSLGRLACVLILSSIPSFADLVLYQGTLADDGDVALLHFSVAGTQLVTIESWGYAGGTAPTQPTPTLIAAGGFAPNLVLFDATGTEVAFDTGGHCGITAQDPVTGNCDDPYLQQTLMSGAYTLAVAEWDSVPNGFLSDGFTGTPGFTCAEFGQVGNFCDVTTALGTVRSGNYAVSIDSGIVATPEPSALGLVAGLLLMLLFYRRYSHRLLS